MAKSNGAYRAGGSIRAEAFVCRSKLSPQPIKLVTSNYTEALWDAGIGLHKGKDNYHILSAIW